MTMRIRLTLHPNQDGAKGLRTEYGDRLGCVRYRDDGQNKKRYKTVEFIGAEEKAVGCATACVDSAVRTRGSIRVNQTHPGSEQFLDIEGKVL